jgi:D-tyrosyl-tRNA(Tyr) deacylase
MKAVIQRVKQASVKINGNLHSHIDKGLLVFLAISRDDDEKDIDYMIEKLLNLRIFSNEEGKFDYSISSIKGEILIVSQFTLYGDTSKGRRPDFTLSAPIKMAEEIYNKFLERLKQKYSAVKAGVFREEMLVSLENDGPVTIIVESKTNCSK